jgi:hypothetical protein
MCHLASSNNKFHKSVTFLNCTFCHSTFMTAIIQWIDSLQYSLNYEGRIRLPILDSWHSLNLQMFFGSCNQQDSKCSLIRFVLNNTNSSVEELMSLLIISAIFCCSIEQFSINNDMVRYVGTCHISPRRVLSQVFNTSR